MSMVFRKTSKLLVLFFGPIWLSSNVLAFYSTFPTNLQEAGFPSTLFAPQERAGFSVRTGFGALFHSNGYTDKTEAVSPINIWGDKINAVATIASQGYDALDNIVAGFLDLADGSLLGPNGYISPRGTISGNYGYLEGCYRYSSGLGFGCKVPIVSLALSDVSIVDYSSVSSQVYAAVTSKISSFAKTYGGLTIGEWSKTGIGDVELFANWVKSFPQTKRYLRNVKLVVNAGLTFPTGEERDLDHFFAMPLGNDGSYGIDFGGALELKWNNVRLPVRRTMLAGLSVELFKPLGTSKLERLKTNLYQNDLLLLKKGFADRAYGIKQRFNLHLGIAELVGKVDFLLHYVFTKQGVGRLTAYDATFNPSIVNSVETLKEWTMHEFIVSARYNPCESEDDKIIPFGAISLRLPFNGTRSVALSGFAVSLGLTF